MTDITILANKIEDPLTQALRCSNILQLMIAGVMHSDVSDGDLRSALQYVADDIEAHLNLVARMIEQHDEAAA